MLLAWLLLCQQTSMCSLGACQVLASLLQGTSRSPCSCPTAAAAIHSRAGWLFRCVHSTELLLGRTCCCVGRHVSTPQSLAPPLERSRRQRFVIFAKKPLQQVHSGQGVQLQCARASESCVDPLCVVRGSCLSPAPAEACCLASNWNPLCVTGRQHRPARASGCTTNLALLQYTGSLVTWSAMGRPTWCSLHS